MFSTNIYQNGGGGVADVVEVGNRLEKHNLFHVYFTYIYDDFAINRVEKHDYSLYVLHVCIRISL